MTTLALPVGPSNVLYVDGVTGHDTGNFAGRRGDLTRPYLTIQAAINAMLTDDVVQIAPQTFAIAATITIPATVVRGRVNGWDPPSAAQVTATPVNPLTVLVAGAGVDLFDFGANLGLTQFVLSGMVLQTTSPALALKGNGSAYAASTFLSGGLFVINCRITGGITFTYLKNLYMTNCIGGSSTAWQWLLCGGLFFGNVFAIANAHTFSRDTADALQPTGLITMRSSSIGGSGAAAIISLTGQPALAVEATSTVGSIRGLGLTANGANVPSVVVAGRIEGNAAAGNAVDFFTAGSELPDTATAVTVDFSGAVFAPAALLARFKVGGAAVNARTVNMNGTKFPAGMSIVAAEQVNLTARGASDGGVYTTPGVAGTVAPPNLMGTIDISAGGALAKTWAQLGYAGLVRVASAAYVALVTPGAALSDTFVPAAGKLATGFTITSVAAVGNTANWRIEYP